MEEFETAGELVAGTDPTEALGLVVRHLYAVAPAEFITSRKEWVARLRKAGLREVAKEAGTLRKPSVSAAAVNALVRAGDPVVQQLRDVGTRLRHAQSALDAAGLAALRGERDGLLTAWVAAAREHSPSGLAASTEAEVRDTAIAALADAEATEVVTSGSLTRALSYSGFGEVDIADAVARTSTGVMLTRIEGGASAAPQGSTEPAEPEATDDDAEEEIGDEAPDNADAVDEEDATDDAVEEDDEDGATEDAASEDEDAAEEDDATDDGTEEDPEEEDAAEEEEPAEDDGVDEEDLAQLAMDLDEAEKGVAAARAGRKQAADAAAKAEHAVKVAKEQVAQAERLLAGATKALDKATRDQDRAAASLEEAEEELRASREQRDAAKVALEEAEDG